MVWVSAGRLPLDHDIGLNMYQDHSLAWKKALQTGLEDDAWQWDWTTLGCLRDPLREVRAQIVCKDDGIWAGASGLEAASVLARELGFYLDCSGEIANGMHLKPGTRVAEWRGPARIVLALERPFLNLAQYVSGIATATQRMVDALEKAWPQDSGPLPRITPTRKTLPGYRDLAIQGVIAGGGVSHRVSLSGGVLIKENHIAAAGGIRAAVDGARAVAPHGLKIEVEVRDENELKQALDAGAEVIMLDNFEPLEVRSAVQMVRNAGSKTLIELSGGIGPANIAQYAIPGVDVISSGGLTHSPKALDLSLLVME